MLQKCLKCRSRAKTARSDDGSAQWPLHMKVYSVIMSDINTYNWAANWPMRTWSETSTNRWKWFLLDDVWWNQWQCPVNLLASTQRVERNRRGVGEGRMILLSLCNWWRLVMMEREFVSMCSRQKNATRPELFSSQYFSNCLAWNRTFIFRGK